MSIPSEVCSSCECLFNRADLCRSCYQCAGCGHDVNCASSDLDEDDWDSLAAEADALVDGWKDGGE